jgi:hypothetical protein
MNNLQNTERRGFVKHNIILAPPNRPAQGSRTWKVELLTELLGGCFSDAAWHDVQYLE